MRVVEDRMGSVISIWKYVKVRGAWRYKAAVMDRGVPVVNMVLVDGRSEYHGEGTYYLRFKKQWIRAGDTPQEVMDTSLRLMENKPIAAVSKPLRQEMDEFLIAYSVGKSAKTIYAMKQVLHRFAELCDP